MAVLPKRSDSPKGTRSLSYRKYRPLGTRLQLPGLAHADGTPRYPGGYADYIIHHQRRPGLGSLAGWRGEDGSRHGTGAPNEKQLEAYIAAHPRLRAIIIDTWAVIAPHLKGSVRPQYEGDYAALTPLKRLAEAHLHLARHDYSELVISLAPGMD